MRKIIISFCFLLAALSLKAQSVNGIRIDGGNTPILVYFGGNQMNLPATSCFVANLKSGYYTIEVYSTRSTRPGERVWKGERLYNERVYFNGSEVKDIFVDGRDDMRPERPGRPGQGGGHRPNHDYYDRVMSEELFRKFMNEVKEGPFESDRAKLINAVLATSYFTSDQCSQLVKFYTFDKERMRVMKLIYPRVVDKEAFFTVINLLTFPTSRDEMYEFVKQYGIR